MNIQRTSFLLLTLLALGANAGAVLPPLPSATNGDGIVANNGMKHLSIDFDESSVTVHAATTMVTMMSGEGVDYTPDQFDVIENQYFNSQYGWNFDNIVVLPEDSAIWIRRMDQTTPAGATLRVYEGGMGMGMANWTMQPLYLNDGDRWMWDGDMQHDMYVADMPGEYSMTYEVYLGDPTTGEALASYGSATTTIGWTVPVPEPGTAALLVLGIAGGIAVMRSRASCW
ncbi:PEP-CTERM sorting domain-containing protein [Aeoliella mucimassa]|uniref:PEP-CTERM sorting domain-containing protein n=1 Tax=Aeoliella mucimassa TaxID=2527972 RepID=UPI0018D329BB|nr:PEP-CTERM sorting domain-containing protein [Aeoliella mucimassa]